MESYELWVVSYELWVVSCEFWKEFVSLSLSCPERIEGLKTLVKNYELGIRS